MDKSTESVASSADDQGTTVDKTTAVASSDAPKGLSSGVIVDQRFEIVSYLGTGGMSTVYKARHLQLNRPVALKRLHERLATDKDARERFHREALAVANLAHPNIVKVYGFGVVSSAPYISMEYLEGISLSDLLKQRTRLTREQALPIFSQILDALEHAHLNGIIHRDLKPSNVMLIGPEQTVKLIDFGIAKILPQHGTELQKLTKSGEIFGTLAYMSPEQCAGSTLDARADLYSMGCLMYEALDGEVPFKGGTPLETATMHLFERPRTSDYLVGVFGSVILANLEKDPSKRPQSASQLKNDLVNSSARPELENQVHAKIQRFNPTRALGRLKLVLGKPWAVIAVRWLMLLFVAMFVLNNVLQILCVLGRALSPSDRADFFEYCADICSQSKRLDWAQYLYSESSKLQSSQPLKQLNRWDKLADACSQNRRDDWVAIGAVKGSLKLIVETKWDHHLPVPDEQLLEQIWLDDVRFAANHKTLDDNSLLPKAKTYIKQTLWDSGRYELWVDATEVEMDSFHEDWDKRLVSIVPMIVRLDSVGQYGRLSCALSKQVRSLQQDESSEQARGLLKDVFEQIIAKCKEHSPNGTGQGEHGLTTPPLITLAYQIVAKYPFPTSQSRDDLASRVVTEFTDVADVRQYARLGSLDRMVSFGKDLDDSTLPDELKFLHACGCVDQQRFDQARAICLALLKTAKPPLLSHVVELGKLLNTEWPYITVSDENALQTMIVTIQDRMKTKDLGEDAEDSLNKVYESCIDTLDAKGQWQKEEATAQELIDIWTVHVRDRREQPDRQYFFWCAKAARMLEVSRKHAQSKKLLEYSLDLAGQLHCSDQDTVDVLAFYAASLYSERSSLSAAALDRAEKAAAPPGKTSWLSRLATLRQRMQDGQSIPESFWHEDCLH